MITLPSRTRAWLELMRLSNLPTVWANVLHGGVAGLTIYSLTQDEVLPSFTLENLGWVLDQAFLLLVATSLIYAGGMILNDVCDVAVDAKERPGRPIVSGRVSRGSALLVSSVMMALGLLGSLVYAQIWVATIIALLIASVITYNLVHRWRPSGLVLLPFCRGLLFLAAVHMFPVAVAERAYALHALLPSAVLMLYIAGVTWLAWSEADKPGRARHVGTLLAALPLVDAAFLLWLGAYWAAGFCVLCSVSAKLAQRFISGS